MQDSGNENIDAHNKRQIASWAKSQPATPSKLAHQWRTMADEAAAGFEARWTVIGLRRHDHDLAVALHEQKELFAEACAVGDMNEIKVHGASLVRGYAAAVRAMEAAEIPDDSYVLGVCPTTGFKVAIGTQKASQARVVELHGQDVVWVSPDEVATLMASSEAFMTVAAIKRKFPGAEVVERYVGEGS
jgi:hypothetical protein